MINFANGKTPKNFYNMIENLDKKTLAALYLYTFGGCDDWHELFKITINPEKLKTLTPGTLQTYTSKWKKSHEVQTALKELQQIKKAQELEIIDKYQNQEKETTKTVETKNRDITNFLSLDEFLKYANEQANTITDEKERRAWVEMIGKYMNFKGSDEGETEQIKAYLPIQCYNCEIYNRCKSCNLSICPVETL